MEIFFITILTLIASTVGTVTGFGTSTIMTPVLAIFLPPVQAIFLVAIIHWFVDVWKVTLFRQGFNWRLVIMFGVIGLVTSYFGAKVSLGTNTEVLLRLLGVFLVVYGAVTLVKSELKIKAGHGAALTGGALSGFFAGLFGTGGAVRAMFLSAFDLPKEVYIATAGAIGLTVDATRIITYLSNGVSLSPNLFWGLLIFIPVSFVGAEIAKRLVDKIPQREFRQVVAAFLFLVGLKLAVWP
jgi:uncharacterized membrane protein YfcA